MLCLNSISSRHGSQPGLHNKRLNDISPAQNAALLGKNTILRNGPAKVFVDETQKRAQLVTQPKNDANRQLYTNSGERQ